MLNARVLVLILRRNLQPIQRKYALENHKSNSVKQAGNAQQNVHI